MTRLVAGSIRLGLISLVLLQFLARSVLLLAQIVGPEIAIRNTTTAGSAMEHSAVFEQGTAYVAWRDTRAEGSSGGDIYAQKINADGQPLWAANGLLICGATNEQTLPAITSDGAGGVVVAWLDDRSNPKAIFAQRVSASGVVQWAADGVFVGPVYSELPFSFVHRSEDGGFLVTWWDSAPFFPTDKYPVLAQKLDENGAGLWDPGDPEPQDIWGSGIEVINGITRGRSATDGAGGFIALGKIRDDGGFRFQRVLADDSTAWPNPVDFTAALPDTVSFNFASDGVGGVIVAYLENRNVRAFRVAGDGTLPWGASGVTLAQTNAVLGQLPFVAPNETGGAFVAWIANTPRDVRVQQIASDGSLLWQAGGAIVPDGSSTEREPVLISDGAGGIFLSFTTATSLRGQRLNRNGEAQWRVNGSNGVGFGQGELPFIGVGTSGPTVVYKRSAGLFAKGVTVAAPFHLTNIVSLANNQLSLTLSGGTPGRDYDMLRSAALVPLPNNAWTLVGTVQSEQTWTDTNPLSPNSFYIAREKAP